MLVSVIIPIYNAEKFIDRCLISVANQTHKTIEVILVDDGSNDKSSEICLKYCISDNRFKLIRKENGGVSSARNRGLLDSNGEYIIFVDPDDWLEKTMVEEMMNLIIYNEAEISICGYAKEKESGELIFSTKNIGVQTYSNIEAINKIQDEDGFKGFVCNKMFKRNTALSVNKVCFHEDIHFCEDLLFCIEIFLKSKKIIYTSKPLYHYVIHENNITKSKYNQKKLTALNAISIAIELLKDKKEVDLSHFKTLFMHINLSLLMNFIKEGNKDEIIYDMLKGNLYKYSITNNNKVKFSIVLARGNLKFFYYLWNFSLR